MPKKGKGKNNNYNKNQFKHERNDKYNKHDKQERHQRKLGTVIVQNFAGTQQQLIQWIKSLFNGKFDTFNVKDKHTHYDIAYFNEDMKDKLLTLNNSLYMNARVNFILNEYNQNEERRKTLPEMIDEILTENFNKETNFVDLSNISNKLAEKGYNKHVDVMLHSKVIQQLKDKYPNTAGIAYCSNNITSLAFFKELERSLPQLVALNLMDNNIKTVDQLEFIKNIPLEVLTLNGNQIIEQREFQLFVFFLFINL